MTPPNDNQTGKPSEAPDFDQTVPLKRCSKHGITYMETETDGGCPECEKEKQKSGG